MPTYEPNSLTSNDESSNRAFLVDWEVPNRNLFIAEFQAFFF